MLRNTSVFSSIYSTLQPAGSLSSSCTDFCRRRFSHRYWYILLWLCCQFACRRRPNTNAQASKRCRGTVRKGRRTERASGPITNRGRQRGRAAVFRRHSANPARRQTHARSGCGGRILRGGRARKGQVITRHGACDPPTSPAKNARRHPGTLLWSSDQWIWLLGTRYHCTSPMLTVFKQHLKLHLFCFFFPGLSPVWLLSGPCSVCCHL